MFTKYDYSKYHTDSLVTVLFGTKPVDDEDFQDFLNKWLLLYELKKDFTFIFNCENVNLVPIKYCIKMSLFIRSLKRKEYQYLKKSIIYIPNRTAKRLLDFIFMIQPPVAPVFIINDLSLVEDILVDKIPDNIEIIYPSKSYLNLF